MARFSFAVLALLGTTVLSIQSASAQPGDPDEGEAPCNSWCQAWMRLGQPDAPAPAAVEPAPSDATAVQTTEPAAEAAPAADAQHPMPAATHAMTKVPDRGSGGGSRPAVAVLKPVSRPVPLPPRRERLERAVAHAGSFAGPIHPASPSSAATSPASPFGSLPPNDGAVVLVAAFPASSGVRPDPVMITTLSLPVRDEPEVATSSLRSGAEAALVQTPGPDVDPVRATAVAVKTVSPAHRQTASNWPPPIDVIGALLAAGPVVRAP